MDRLEPEEREPVFNVPLVVASLIGVFILVHLVSELAGEGYRQWLLTRFAFIPARFAPPPELAGVQFPGGAGAWLWTFVSYGFLHADWLHVIINSVWMLAFGAVLARRFGTLRFLLFSVVGTILSAAASLVVYWGELMFLVGASGAVSAHMGGAVRLMFATPAGLRALGIIDVSRVRALPLASVLANRQAVTFIFVWVAINFVVAFTGLGTGGGAGRIAWEAHIGGFAAGLFLFGLFDRKQYGEGQLFP